MIDSRTGNTASMLAAKTGSKRLRKSIRKIRQEKHDTYTGSENAVIGRSTRPLISGSPPSSHPRRDDGTGLCLAARGDGRPRRAVRGTTSSKQATTIVCQSGITCAHTKNRVYRVYGTDHPRCFIHSVEHPDDCHCRLDTPSSIRGISREKWSMERDVRECDQVHRHQRLSLLLRLRSCMRSS